MRTTPTDTRRWLQLADGRQLAYTATGPPDGIPVVYCHGAIGTPVSATVDLEALTAELGVYYIAPSRPGIGGSDPDPTRTIRSYADDVRQLADHLGLDNFNAVGVSAGGPYALALSHRLRSRVTRVAVVSSLSPLCAPHATPGLRRRVRYPLATLYARPGFVRRLGNGLLSLLAAHPGLVNAVISAHAAPSERARLATAGERLAATTSFFDACTDGVGGLVEDYRVYAGAWGFDPAEVYSEVDLWHGVADPLVPVQHALQLSAALPHCRTFFDPEEGHHFFRARLATILEQLVAPEAEIRLARVRIPAGAARSPHR